MIDKIKKLVESTSYDDNRLALILIAEYYKVEGLKKLISNGGATSMWGICPDRGAPNGILIENAGLFYTRDGDIAFYTDPGFKESENFIRWNLKEKESE